MDWNTLLEETLLMFGEHGESVLRLLLAAALGGIIGLEREASAKPAGFRTNLLICVGAALLTDLSAFIARDASLAGGLRGDPGRIAAQIVSGIGFLGAGTIMRSRGTVLGLTTAATLWVVAAIGMAVGAGAYLLAVTGTLIVMVALVTLGRIDERLVRRPHDRTIRVELDPRPDLVAGLEQQLVQAGYQLGSIHVEKLDDVLVASFDVRRAGGDYDRAMRMLLAHEGVRQVTLS